MWKGAGAPEVNVMDDGKGTYVPDNPKTSEVTFRKQEPEKNVYEDEDVRPPALPQSKWVHQTCDPRFFPRFKDDGFLPQTQHVNLIIVG